MTRLLFIALVVALTLPLAARADQTDPRLDDLFARLEAAPDAAAAKALSDRIWRIWIETENDDAALLLDDGMRLMQAGRAEAALSLFDRLVEIAPRFAEAWNKRATVHYLLDHYQESVDDIERTLELEPRHFGALSGLGLIYMETGRDAVALKAFEAALDLNPFLPAPREHVKALRNRLKKKEI